MFCMAELAEATGRVIMNAKRSAHKPDAPVRVGKSAVSIGGRPAPAERLQPCLRCEIVSLVALRRWIILCAVGFICPRR